MQNKGVVFFFTVVFIELSILLLLTFSRTVLTEPTEAKRTYYGITKPSFKIYFTRLGKLE